MKRISRAAPLAIAIAVVAACSRPNLQSTGGGYGPGAAASAVGEPSADVPAAAGTSSAMESDTAGP